MSNNRIIAPVAGEIMLSGVPDEHFDPEKGLDPSKGYSVVGNEDGTKWVLLKDDGDNDDLEICQLTVEGTFVALEVVHTGPNEGYRIPEPTWPIWPDDDEEEE